MLQLQQLVRHTDSVNTLVLHGDLLLTGSEDKDIKVDFTLVREILVSTAILETVVLQWCNSFFLHFLFHFL